MKLIVRAFVVALALTGAVASAYTSKPTVESIKPTLGATWPVPTCPPNDPNGCGMGS